MTDYDPQLEHDLASLKEAIAPSRDLTRRIARFAEAPARRASLWFPAAAVVILVIAVFSFQNRGQQKISRDDTINRLVYDAQTEQSIANESDADVALIIADRAELDAFAETYNANEY